MFAGIEQEYRGVFSGGPSSMPATPSTSPTAGLFAVPPPLPPNHRDDSAASVKDEDTARDCSDTQPILKRARTYTEDEWVYADDSRFIAPKPSFYTMLTSQLFYNLDRWTRNVLFKREINFARHPIRILGRRYPLTKTTYKYVDVAVLVGRQSRVDIALGDYHGKEISLTPDMWKDLLSLRNDILQYFDLDSDETAGRPPTTIIMGNMTIRFGKINNLKMMRFETPKNRITMSQCTVKALFTLELCVNRIVASLTGILEAVDAKLSRFLDIAMATDLPSDILNAIRRNEHFNANDLIDCELHALIFGLYYNL